MGRLLDGTDLGSTDNKILSVTEIKTLGWDSSRPSGATSDNVLGDDASFTFSIDSNDSGVSSNANLTGSGAYVSVTITFVQSQSNATQVSGSSVVNASCSLSSGSGQHSGSGSTTYTYSNFTPKKGTSGYCLKIAPTASLFPNNYQSSYYGTQATIHYKTFSDIKSVVSYLNGRVFHVAFQTNASSQTVTYEVNNYS